MRANASQRVLLVDDEPEVRTAFARLLERRLPGVRVVGCEDAEAALALLEREAFHVVIADYRMPGMDGLAFLAEVRRLTPTVRRALFTAFVEPEIMRQTLGDGLAHDFVPKDIEPERFVERVAALLALERSARHP